MTPSFDKKQVLVLGSGRSGCAAARQLLRLGARVTSYDRNPGAGRRELPDGVERISGDTLPSFEGYDLVVASPGIPVQAHPGLWPEIDLAHELIPSPIVGVTGTNGKSTTSVLLARMLEASGLTVGLGGNLGTPLCDLAPPSGPAADWVVAELSSFQLEHAERFHAEVAVLLNLTPDHLDRHHSFEAYGAAKARLVERQRASDTVVFSADDRWAQRVAEVAPSRAVPFSTGKLLRDRPDAAFLDQGSLAVVREERPFCHIALEKLSPASRSPIQNALAAAAAAAHCGASAAGIASALESFEGLPHRNQLVGIRAGVRFVNDSKATNPEAAAASLGARTAPVVWLAGGRNKGLRFDGVADAAQGIRGAVLFGESAEDLERALRADGKLEVLRCESLAEAVPAAARLARTGDTVLLSPACASFDQFESYEERGECFAMLVRNLSAQEDETEEAEPC